MDTTTSMKQLLSRLTGTIDMKVQFTDKIESLESYPEGKMRAIIKKFGFGLNDMAWVVFDYEPYRVYNLPLEKSNYFNQSGEAVLTASEAGQYTPTERIYFMANDAWRDYFEFIADEHDLLTVFLQERVGDESYIEWLERQVRLQRASDAPRDVWTT